MRKFTTYPAQGSELDPFVRKFNGAVPVERSGRHRRKKWRGIFRRNQREGLGRRWGTKVMAGKHCRREFPRTPERELLQMPLSRFLNRNSLFL